MFIGGICGTTDVEEIRWPFEHFGKVINVHVPTREGRPRNFAFFRFFHKEVVHRVFGWKEPLVVNGKRIFVAATNRRRGAHPRLASYCVSGGVGGGQRNGNMSFKEVVVSGNRHGGEDGATHVLPMNHQVKNKVSEDQLALA